MKLLDDYFFGFSWSRKTIFFEETVEAEFHHKTYGNIYLYRKNKKHSYSFLSVINITPDIRLAY